ncbi:MAG: TraB/GumN family protein [Deltaproteobacteria bacterium]|nr:TraB/GumN family protein [Deltaproteobacteria bacterium]MDQ3299215.1 TraB/GumN family protein [Myxococcota bacterium]
MESPDVERSQAPAATEAPLPDSVTELVHDGVTYYIVGTAHVSQRSVEEVRAVIERVKPDVVCVELDKTRFDALTKDSAFRDLDVFKVVREGRTLYLLAHLALASYQRRIGASLGVKPGAELLAAVQAAKELGIPVELIDRDINITLKRTWSNLGLWKRSMLLSSLVVGWDDDKGEPVTARSVEDLKEAKALSEMLSELGRAVPQIKGPLIDERDQYMASKSIDIGTGKRRIVAVVGAAHVPGMKANWGQPIDRAALDRLPPPSLVWRAIKWLVPILFLAAIVWGWQRSDATSFTEMMLAWILPTSIGAGVLTLLAGGSILSVLAALVVAPVAAIHPLLGTGMVVGVVEAWRRRPNVADCERLPEDIQSMRGFWRNPVTRILLIAVASGIGTAVGFWVGVGWVASML